MSSAKFCLIVFTATANRSYENQGKLIENLILSSENGFKH